MTWSEQKAETSNHCEYWWCYFYYNQQMHN